MKKIILLIIMLLLIISTTVYHSFATSDKQGKIGTAKYKYIKGSKELHFYGGQLPEDLTTNWDESFRSEVVKVVFDDVVTTKGSTKALFDEYTSLEKIEGLNKLDVSNEDSEMKGTGPYYILPLTKDRAEKLKSYPFIKSITIIDDTYNEGYNNLVWPYSKDYLWTRDNFGPLWIPKKDVTIKLNLKNIVLYDRIITAYEGNKLNVKNGKIYINGKVADSYTFKMNYYFMMGDNRHKSADSRYWGFVPEDHIVGEPLLVWLSLNKDKSLFNAKIRWNRFFKWVAGKGSMD